MKKISRELTAGIIISLFLHISLLALFPLSGFLGRGKTAEAPSLYTPLIVSTETTPASRGKGSTPEVSNTAREAEVSNPAEIPEIKPTPRTEVPQTEVPRTEVPKAELPKSDLPAAVPPEDSPLVSVQPDATEASSEEIIQQREPVVPRAASSVSTVPASENIEPGSPLFPVQREGTPGLRFVKESEEGGPALQDNLMLLDNFIAELKTKIDKELTYPLAARNRGVEGRVIMEVWVGMDGSLKSVGIRESSGSSILDRSALHLVRSLFPREHSLNKDFKITLFIEYRLTV